MKSYEVHIDNYARICIYMFMTPVRGHARVHIFEVGGVGRGVCGVG